MCNVFSLMARDSLCDMVRGERYQRILAALSTKPCTREELEEYTNTNGNTIRPRVKELMGYGIIEVVGEGKTQSNRRCEKLGLTKKWIN